MAAAGLGALAAAGGPVSSIMSAGVEAVKLTVESGGKVIKAVRDDRAEIEIPGWALGNKKGDPVKIPSQVFGYIALGLGIYAIARMFGVRPFDWLVMKLEETGYAGPWKWETVKITDEAARAKGVADIAAKAGSSVEDIERLYVAQNKGVITVTDANAALMWMKANKKTLAEFLEFIRVEFQYDPETTAKWSQV